MIELEFYANIKLVTLVQNVVSSRKLRYIYRFPLACYHYEIAKS